MNPATAESLVQLLVCVRLFTFAITENGGEKRRKDWMSLGRLDLPIHRQSPDGSSSFLRFTLYSHRNPCTREF
ncbi:hypothetical protein FB451DRAFT_1241937 [Mycena latifolia]|nr:hypothetical protein FB451DRAFT_1241937 [Mycena latifolia]